MYFFNKHFFGEIQDVLSQSSTSFIAESFCIVHLEVGYMYKLQLV